MSTLLQKYGIGIPLIVVVILSITGLMNQHDQHWSTILLSTALVYGLGFQLTIAGALHIFAGDSIASYIGWERGSPFQYEVGVAGIAF